MKGVCVSIYIYIYIHIHVHTYVHIGSHDEFCANGPKPWDPGSEKEVQIGTRPNLALQHHWRQSCASKRKGFLAFGKWVSVGIMESKMATTGIVGLILGLYSAHRAYVMLKAGVCSRNNCKSEEEGRSYAH